MEEKKFPAVLKLAILAGLLIGIIAFFYFFITENQGFLHEIAATYGLVGLFLGGLISHATVFLPVPFDAVIFFVGADPQLVGIEGFPILEVLLVSVVAALGAALGEMTAYIAGLTGVSAAELHNRDEFRYLREVRERLKNYGMLFIFVVSIFPFPFDLIGITAGIIKFDYRKFFAATFLGKTLRYTIVLFAGQYGFSYAKTFLGFG